MLKTLRINTCSDSIREYSSILNSDVIHEYTSMSKILDDEDYCRIVQNYLKKDVEILSTEWSPLSENIQGFMGQHYYLVIKYKSGGTEGTGRFFVKTKPTQTDIQKEIYTQINVYQKEIFLYNHLCREYERCGLSNQFSPKCYYCKDTETIVMEDLSERGYRLKSKKDFYDLDACKAALKALAGFHSSLMIYEEIKSKELQRVYRVDQEYPEEFKEPFYVREVESIGFQYVEVTKECLIKLSERLPESREWIQSFQDRLKGFDSTSVFTSEIPGRKSCGHGDLWCNNILFSYTNDIPDSCRLIDYQVLRYHHPGFDVMLLLYLNTLSKFRQEHLQDLIRYYYEEFSEMLKSHGFVPNHILSKPDFLESCRLLEGIAVLQAICGRSLTHLPLEMTNDSVASKEVDLEDIFFKNRAKYVIEGCERDEFYKNLLIEDIYDLNNFI